MDDEEKIMKYRHTKKATGGESERVRRAWKKRMRKK